MGFPFLVGISNGILKKVFRVYFVFYILGIKSITRLAAVKRKLTRTQPITILASYAAPV